MTEINFDYVRGETEYIDILKRAIEYEENNKKSYSYLTRDDRDYDSCWKAADVRANGNRLYQLVIHGFLEKVYDSSNKSKYSLTDRKRINNWVENREETLNQDGIPQKTYDFPDELPDDLFSQVVGPYDNVKWLLKRGLTTNKITNFLLIGPPGSAKTVFLLALNNYFSEAEYIVSSEATSAGVMEIMFNEMPKIMLVDEFDDMDNDDQSAFASYTETGIIRETKSGKQRKMKINTKTFGAGNDKSKFKDNILDRFTVIEFDAYTRAQFINVCKQVLPDEENVTKTEAVDIGKAVWSYRDSGDVRQAIQVARLSRGDPDRVVEVLDEYSDDTVRDVL